MRLRTILFVVMIIVAAVPVAILAFWEQQQSLDQEIQSVSEKHLLVASNLTIALDRYIRDAQVAFQANAEHMLSSGEHGSFQKVLSAMGFRHVCLVDGEGRIKRIECALHCPESYNFHLMCSMPWRRNGPGPQLSQVRR